MESSSLCEKNKIELWKTQDISFESTLKNSPFDMEVLAQNKWRKTLKEIGKTSSKTSPKSCIKLAKIAPFYRATKTSRWGKSQARWPVGRLAGRPANSHIHDRWGCGRSHPGQKLIGWPVGQPRQEPESTALWPVDRGQIQRVNSLDRSTARSIGP